METAILKAAKIAAVVGAAAEGLMESKSELGYGWMSDKLESVARVC